MVFVIRNKIGAGTKSVLVLLDTTTIMESNQTKSVLSIFKIKNQFPQLGTYLVNDRLQHAATS